MVFILNNSFSYSCVIWTFFFAAIYSPTPIGTICEDKRSLIFYSLIHDTASARWQPDGGKELKTYLKTNQKYCDSNCNNRALLLSGATIKITSYKNRARPFDPFFSNQRHRASFYPFFFFILSFDQTLLLPDAYGGVVPVKADPLRKEGIFISLFNYGTTVSRTSGYGRTFAPSFSVV